MQVFTELKLVTRVTFKFSNYLEGAIAVILLGGNLSWTHVKEIPSTKLLVSLHHHRNKSANMSVFDISKRAQIKEIYSLGEVSGGSINYLLPSCLKNCIFSLGTGYGDITYNSRRNLDAVPLDKKFSYYLFNVDSNASKTKDIVKLIRKSKCHSQCSNHQS